MLVLAVGVGQFVVLHMGPSPRGCSGMVREFTAILGLAAAVVVGVPHLVAPMWFLRRPGRGRRVFLGLIVVNALVDGVFAVMVARDGERWLAALWLHLLAVNVIAAWILLVRGRRTTTAS